MRLVVLSDRLRRKLHDLSKCMYNNVRADDPAFDWQLELVECAKYINRIIREEKNSMLLYPDMRREQYEGNDNFVFATPCTKSEWDYLHGKSEQSEHYLPYFFAKEYFHENAPPDLTCIILRHPEITDEQAVTTAAWIRVSEEYTGMIYAVSYESVPTVQSLSSIVARTAGCNPKQVKHIEIKRSNV